MIDLVTALAVLTALAAAARSTWSPCGLSMLSSITPLSERARGHRYAVTAGWFIAGATAGGATLGGIAAALAFGVAKLGPSPDVVGAVGALAALCAVLVDANVTPARVPLIRRQVNERWLDQFRGWFYGAAFGWQIGVGFATYLMTAAVALAVVLAALTGSALSALLICTAFGAARGMIVLASRRLQEPLALRSFHRKLDSLETPVRNACIVVEAAVVLACAGATSPVGFLLAGVALFAVAVIRRWRPLPV